MMLQSIPYELSKMLAKLFLQDLLDENFAGELTEYLSLSLIQSNGEIRISFTTTDKTPVTYTTVISAAEKVDFQSLVFSPQSGY